MSNSKTDIGADGSADDSGLDRRKFIQKVGVGTAVAGGAWAAPTILGSSVAFAQGSAGGPTTVPTTTDPANLLCGTIDWPVPSSNTANNVNSNITFPVNATGGSGVQLLSVNGSTTRPLAAVVVGPNPPSLIYPRGAALGSSIIQYRNLRANSRPIQTDSGSLVPSTATDPGFIIAQNNQNGGNTSFSSIVNYQEVTFTLSTAVYNLRFSIRDFTATTIDPNDTTFDSYGPAPTYAFNYSNPWGKHRDTVGFDVPVILTGGISSGNVQGTGTYADPFRRGVLFGTSGTDSSIDLAIPGPVTSFTIRYATVGGWGSQWIQLSDMAFGNCAPTP